MDSTDGLKRAQLRCATATARSCSGTASVWTSTVRFARRKSCVWRKRALHARARRRASRSCPPRSRMRSTSPGRDRRQLARLPALATATRRTGAREDHRGADHPGRELGGGCHQPHPGLVQAVRGAEELTALPSVIAEARNLMAEEAVRRRVGGCRCRKRPSARRVRSRPGPAGSDQPDAQWHGGDGGARRARTLGVRARRSGDVVRVEVSDAGRNHEP